MVPFRLHFGREEVAVSGYKIHLKPTLTLGLWMVGMNLKTATSSLPKFNRHSRNTASIAETLTTLLK